MTACSAVLSVLVCVATLALVSASINQWRPEDFNYHTTKSSFGEEAFCDEGTVVYFGLGLFLNPEFRQCLTPFRNAQVVCEPGKPSCFTDGPSCKRDDETYIHIVCGPPEYLVDTELQHTVGNPNFMMECPTPGQHIMLGLKGQISDRSGNNDGGCVNTNRETCAPGFSDCTIVPCNTYGNDEAWIGLYCTEEPVGAIAVVDDTQGNAATSAQCPDGMWAFWAFNWYYSPSNSLDCHDHDGCCQRTVAGRACNSASYIAWGETLTNPAQQCGGDSCTDSNSGSNTLNLMCVCLPGFARLDPSGGCTACELGQRPTEYRESCRDCDAGTYCPRPDLDAEQCGGNHVFCPSKSSAPTPVTDGYYTTGGTPLNRTGQQPCDPGSYCVGGVAYTCPVGTLSGHGHSSCTNCTAGTFSNVEGVSW